MAYDEQLARRVRPLMALRPGFSEKRMFGGIAYFIEGNLCVGVSRDSLFARVGAEAYHAALDEPLVSIFGPANRPMRGWVQVAPEGLADMAAVRRWVERAVPSRRSGAGFGVRSRWEGTALMVTGSWRQGLAGRIGYRDGLGTSFSTARKRALSARGLA